MAHTGCNYHVVVARFGLSELSGCVFKSTKIREERRSVAS